MLRSLIEDTPLREVAVLLADVIRMTPQPLTLVLEGLLDDGIQLRLDADHPGSRPVDAGKGRHEDSRLIPGGLNQLICRTARLTCPGPDGDLTVARTELAWLEQRIPYDACRELRQGTEPAGKILARWGMHRDDRQSIAVWPREGDVAVRSSAALMLGATPVAIAYEHITADFCELLRARAPGPQAG